MPRRFLVTGVRLPDTSTDQTHMQLSRSYIIAYADSSLNEILWNIETSLWKSSPWEVLEEQKRNTRCFFFGKRSQEKVSATLMESEFKLFLRLVFLQWRLRSFLTLAFLSSWVHNYLPPPPHTHSIMDARNNEHRIGLTHTWVTFNQSEMSLPRRVGGRGRVESAGKVLVTAGGGSGGEWEVSRKIPEKIYTFLDQYAKWFQIWGANFTLP